MNPRTTSTLSTREPPGPLNAGSAAPAAGRERDGRAGTDSGGRRRRGSEGVRHGAPADRVADVADGRRGPVGLQACGLEETLQNKENAGRPMTERPAFS